MVVVESSAWLEFLSDGLKANAYAPYLKEPEKVVTSAVVVYEVYKKIKRERGEEMAKLCVGQMEKTRLVPIDPGIALRAADPSLEFSLPMVGSSLLATARAFGAELITSDIDFREVPGARVLRTGPQRTTKVPNTPSTFSPGRREKTYRFVRIEHKDNIRRKGEKPPRPIEQNCKTNSPPKTP